MRAIVLVLAFVLASVPGQTATAVPPTGTCAAPIDIADGDRVTGDTSFGADLAYSPQSDDWGHHGLLAPEHVFAVTLAEPSFVHVRVESAAFDPLLYARASCLDAATELGFDHDTDDRDTMLGLALPAGTTFVFLDGYFAGDMGAYELSVHVGDPWLPTLDTTGVDGFAGERIFVRGQNLSHTERVVLGGVEAPHPHVRSIFGQQRLHFEVPFGLAPGDHPIEVTTREGTTTACCVRVAAGAVDVAVTILSMSPPTDGGAVYGADEQVEVVVQIANEGAQTARDVYARLELGAQAAGERDVSRFAACSCPGQWVWGERLPTLGAGESVVRTLTMRTLGLVGDVTAYASANMPDIRDANYANNGDQAQRSFVVAGNGHGTLFYLDHHLP